MLKRAICVPVCALILSLGGTGKAQEEVATAETPEVTRETPGGGNLIGHRGLLRTVAAINQPVGTVGLGTDFQFFSAGEFLPGVGDAAKLDHSRLVNSYTIVWAPLRYLEAAFGLNVISDSSSSVDSEELQVTVGDPELSIKGGYEVYEGVTLGALLDGKLLTGAGFFEAGESGFSLGIAALASWFGGNKLPLGVHLNLGYFLDGSDSLFDNPEQLSPAQLFAAQFSSFDRVLVRFGLEYVTRYVGPFLELTLEPFVGSGAPGFGDSPSRLSFGLQGWLGERRGLQLLAALDIGLTGVGDGEPQDLDPGKYAFVIPRWNLSFRLSYRFDPFYSPPARIVQAKGDDRPAAELARSAITGKVLDSQSMKPVWNARIKVVDNAASSLAVDPKDGSFRTFDVPLGTRTIVASADGYLDTRVLLDVTDKGAKTVVQMTPKVRFTPGTIRGTVTARGGRELSAASILIPELDRTIALGRDGTFRVTLKPGQYKVVVSSPGMRTQERSVRVIEGDTVILNVELYKVVSARVELFRSQNQTPGGSSK